MEFLVFGEDWGRHPSSSQHILTALMAHYDVTWINSIGLRQPKLNWRDIDRIKEKLYARLDRHPPRQCTHTNNQTSGPAPTTIIKPLVWPVAQSPVIRTLNNAILNLQLRRKQKQRIVWVALPSAVDYLDICDSDLVIYYCGDDFSSLADVDHQYVTVKEKQLIDRADIILACSSTLQNKFPAKKTWLLPHGVALSQFAKPASCPADISQNQPSIGFYGSINNWLDQKLLVHLAQARPTINFYLVGPVNTDITALSQIPNIHFLPAKPHHQLAGYLQHWTAAILPFVDNAQIRACNPLKLREYLAAGCPVISADFPAVHPYRPLVTTATSPDAWLKAIDNCCQLNHSERQAYANQASLRITDESWDKRANTVIELVKTKLMPEKTD